MLYNKIKTFIIFQMCLMYLGTVRREQVVNNNAVFLFYKHKVNLSSQREIERNYHMFSIIAEKKTLKGQFRFSKKNEMS